MKYDDFRLALRQIKSDRIRQLTAVMFLQSAYRGYLARKRVQKIRERGYGQETATIFFLLQLENSCEHLYHCQETSLRLESMSRRPSSVQVNEKKEEKTEIEEKLASDMLEMLQAMRS